MKRAVGLALISSLFATSCATSSSNIAASYVSPLQYQGYDCDQILAEGARIRTRVSELSGRLDQAADNDKVLMGVGLLLFWPALIAVGGNQQQEAEFARLKGEYDALQSAAIQKKCASAVGPSRATLPAVPAAAPAAIPVSAPN